MQRTYLLINRKFFRVFGEIEIQQTLMGKTTTTVFGSYILKYYILILSSFILSFTPTTARWYSQNCSQQAS